MIVYLQNVTPLYLVVYQPQHLFSFSKEQCRPISEAFPYANQRILLKTSLQQKMLLTMD